MVSRYAYLISITFKLNTTYSTINSLSILVNKYLLYICYLKLPSIMYFYYISTYVYSIYSISTYVHIHIHIHILYSIYYIHTYIYTESITIDDNNLL